MVFLARRRSLHQNKRLAKAVILSILRCTIIRRGTSVMRRASAIFAVLMLLVIQHAMAQPRVVSSLGRIEPAGGVLRLAGPSGLGSVIMNLRVEEGQQVKAGDVIATLFDSGG